jgi:hypothetical protein
MSNLVTAQNTVNFIIQMADLRSTVLALHFHIFSGGTLKPKWKYTEVEIQDAGH